MPDAGVKQAHRLGDLLLARRLVTREQLDSAIAEQTHSHAPLGSILLQRRLITQRQLRLCLRRQSVLRRALAVGTLALSPVQLVQAEAVDAVAAAVLERSHSRESKDPAALPWNSSGRGSAFGFEYLPDYSVASYEPADSAAGTVVRLSHKPTSTGGWNLLKQEYRGGVRGGEAGLRYKLKWSKDSLKIKASYQF